MSGPRRKSRELALQYLFQKSFQDFWNAKGNDLKGNDLKKSGVNDYFHSEDFLHFCSHFQNDSDVFDYASLLSQGVLTHRQDVDRCIQESSQHWKIDRMALVDLNVIRIAVYEMKWMQPALPPGVAINEAVEMAKRFGSTESGAFVNGILDQVAKTHLPPSEPLLRE